ncbi:Signal transduction histidine kinase [Sphingomonas guangdongensis]|uniref:histidine kinase n=1 Tax=Sphingomonas guangdongensis TaxID=1141890 RepID=A0A285QZH7_9SPHN|nr:ATP-binding protein [Sphingomonas guangdongensis]SOB86908.1 Signal transduction histidine kinase [Sphingomonas guangdongensis]
MSGWGTSRAVTAVYANWRTIMLTIVALLGAGVLFTMIYSLADGTRERDRALRLQSHSYEVMILTRTLAGTMARAEAALGRYVISTDRTLGQQYSAYWVLAGEQIRRLGIITRDNSEQTARVAALRQAYQERGDELALIALSTNYSKNAQALARFYRARDGAALARIDTLLKGLIASERHLLTERSATALESIETSNRAVKLFAGFGIALMIGAIVLGYMTVRALADRAISSAEADAERQRSELLQLAVADATRELHAEAAERAAAEARLRQIQKLDAVGQLTGGIAHDFNNMLAVVLGGIELAKRRHLDGGADVLRHLDSAAEGASRASALTRRLLAFARSEPLLPQAVEARALIEGMRDLIDRTLGDLIQVRTAHAQPGWHVWVDRHGLENAILNLAVNARDAMDGRGTLTIATGAVTLAEHEVGHCAAGDYATIAVTDTGVGMTPEVIDRVFEPFFTTKPVGKGTGLGLSQIFGFVQQSRGDIAIRSAPGEGCTVTIYLPRHAAADSGASTAPVLVEAIAGRQVRPLQVLVVEDDPRVLSATVAALTELGHQPIACNDPLKAMAVANNLDVIDLIISDVLMPGKTGPELVGELSQLRPDAAVLFVTGYAGEAGEAEDFGGHGVLRKPFTIAGLDGAVRQALAARGATPAVPQTAAA